MNYLIKKAINLNGNDLVMDTLDISYAKREIYIIGEITDEMATIVNSALRCLARDSDEDITLFIQSPGDLYRPASVSTILLRL